SALQSGGGRTPRTRPGVEHRTSVAPTHRAGQSELMVGASPTPTDREPPVCNRTATRCAGVYQRTGYQVKAGWARSRPGSSDLRRDRGGQFLVAFGVDLGDVGP